MKGDIETQDFTELNKIIDNKIGSGNYTGIDLAIQAAVKKGDWTVATQAIDAAMGMSDKYPLMTAVIGKAIQSGDYSTAAKTIDAYLAGYDFSGLSYAIAESITGPDQQKIMASVADLQDRLGSVFTNLAAKGTSLAEVMDTYIKDELAGGEKGGFEAWLQLMLEQGIVTDDQLEDMRNYYVGMKKLYEGSEEITNAAFTGGSSGLGEKVSDQLNYAADNFINKLSNPTSYNKVAQAIIDALNRD